MYKCRSLTNRSKPDYEDDYNGYDMKKIGQILKKLRVENGYSQVSLAKLMQTSKQVVYNYEKGKNKVIPYRVMQFYENFFHCTYDYLLGLSDNKERNRDGLIEPCRVTKKIGNNVDFHLNDLVIQCQIKRQDINSGIQINLLKKVIELFLRENEGTADQIKFLNLCVVNALFLKENALVVNYDALGKIIKCYVSNCPYNKSNSIFMENIMRSLLDSEESEGTKSPE